MTRIPLPLLLILSMLNLFSQNDDIAYPHVVPMTPNAAELAKFEDCPVSHYTGTPNIEIPLYELNIDGLKIPIILKYHASGIKVNQEATWVGLGWSLDIGNRISRTIKSADDFGLAWDRNFPFVQNGYFDGPEVSDIFNTHYGGPTGSNCYGWDYPLINDPEPDIFYYSLPGLGGKFLLDKSRGAMLFDRSHNLKVEVIKGTNDVKFNVTDMEGNQYFFNSWEITKNYTANGWINKNVHNAGTVYDDDTIDFPNWTSIREDCDPGGDTGTPYPTVTSWCLTKIITKLGSEINFNYATETQYLPTQESCEKYNHNGQGAIFYNKSKVVNTALRLATITGEFGYIQFSTSERDDIKGTSRKLDAIQVYDHVDNQVKKFKFDYSHFNDSYSGNPLYTHVFKRLKLDKVTEYSSTNQPLNDGYVFDYYPGGFPAKNSKNVDYWGYQNGRSYGSNYYIGLRLLNNDIYQGVKKDADFEKTIIGTLKTITYPTGGLTEFKFEGNTISSSFIETSTYENSVSNLVNLPVFNNYISDDAFYSGYPSQDIHTFQVYAETTITVNCQLENVMGTRDPSYAYESYSNPLGKLRQISPGVNDIYTYTCPPVWDPTPTYPQGEGGEIILVERQFTLQPGTYEFEAYTPPNDTYAGWQLQIDNYIPNTAQGPFDAGGIRIKEIVTDAKTRKFIYPVGTMLTEPVFSYLGRRAGLPYNYTTFPLVQISESATPLSTFNNGNFVGYDWVEEYAVDDDDDRAKTKYTFHNDMESDRFDDFPDSPIYINYTNGLIKTIEKYKTVNMGSDILVQKEEFTYTNTLGNVINAFRDKGPGLPGSGWDRLTLPYYYQTEWPLKTKTVVTLRTDSGEDIVTETNNVYNSKDLLQSTTLLSDGTELTQKTKYAFDLTDATSQAMVAKNIIGVPVETISMRENAVVKAIKTEYLDVSGIFLPQTIKKAELNSATATEANYSSYYQPYLNYDGYDSEGNLLEVSRPDGPHTFYVWGYYQQYPIAKIEGFDSQQDMTPLIQSLITDAQDYSESDDDQCTDKTTCEETYLRAALKALRDALPGSMVTTYTYNPLVGMTSLTDPNGYTTYFEYDTFNRLTRVMDADGNILNENEYNYKQ